jgi:ABC-type molybdate transport system substrate-binding protein
VTASQRAPIAKEFVDYVTSAAGRAILERYGFASP